MKYQKPKRLFEKSGLVNPNVSYHVILENVTNTDKQDIKTMVDQGRYFSIFAPRQSGKTTFFRGFCYELEKKPLYVAIFLSFEPYSKYSPAKFYQFVQEELYTHLIERLREVKCQQLDKIQSFLESHQITDSSSFFLLFKELNRIIKFKKIVILIDEFDGIPLEELENFLTTLRKLYQQYKQEKNKALYSVGLVGIQNITKLVLGGISPFNIADQVSLPPFTLKNLKDLYAQYTEETNQSFTEEAINRVYEMTAGQPWLINRLGSILTINIKPSTTEPISVEEVDQAVVLLLGENNSHFDNLWEKVKDYQKNFVVITKNEIDYSPYDENHSWLRQNGLVAIERGKAKIANPIYQKLFLKAFENGIEDSEEKSEKEVFLSYAWEGESESIVNQLDKTFQEKGIVPIRDKRDLGFKGKIQDFMEQIGQGKYVVVVIGKKYLESSNCMFELVQIAKNGKFYDRIFPIMLADAQIYDPIHRIQYIKYWEKKIQDLEEELKGVSPAYLQGFREDLDRYHDIRNTMAELISILKDMNTLSPEEHKNSDFQQLFRMIEKKPEK